MNVFSRVSTGLLVAVLMSAGSAEPIKMRCADTYDYVACGGIAGALLCLAYAYNVAQTNKAKKAKLDKKIVCEREAEKLQNEIDSSKSTIDFAKALAVPVAVVPILAWGLNLKARLQPAVVGCDLLSDKVDQTVAKDALKDLLDKVEAKKDFEERAAFIKDHKDEFEEIFKNAGLEKVLKVVAPALGAGGMPAGGPARPGVSGLSPDELAFLNEVMSFVNSDGGRAIVSRILSENGLSAS